MTDTNEKQNLKAENDSGSAAQNKPWLWPGLIGLLLAFLLLAVLMLWVRPALDKPAAAPIDPLVLQTENLSAIENEIAALRDALALDPCALPPLAGAKPFSSPLTLPEGGAQPEAAAAPDSLADRVERATVMILVDSEEELGTGSGFFVASDLVMTNRHVIESALGQPGQIYVTNKALGGLVKARVIRSTGPDELRDYAFLSVSPPANSGHSVLTLSTDCKRTDRVSAWGYPYLFTQTDPQLSSLIEGDPKAVPEVVYSAGVVSVIQELHGLKLINHTAEVSPGSSGGPLINERGQVVGVNTMIRVDDESSRQVNVALGSGDIISFAAGLGLAAPAQ